MYSMVLSTQYKGPAGCGCTLVAVHGLLSTLYFLARLGRRLGSGRSGEGEKRRSGDSGRTCSDAAGGPAAVGAAPQAVPVRAALIASTPAVLIVRHIIC